MFRFTQEPSSGSQSLCLTKITGMVPLCLLICALSVSWRNIQICLRVCVWFTVQEGTNLSTFPHGEPHTLAQQFEYAARTLIKHISTSKLEPYL